MAKAPGTKKNAWDVDFVQLELTAQDKETAKKWDVKFEQTFDCLCRCSVDGYKLSVTYDRRNDCAIAALTSPKPEGGANSLCFTARGPDLLQAMRMLAYKIVVLLDGDMSALGDVAQSRSQWG